MAQDHESKQVREQVFMAFITVQNVSATTLLTILTGVNFLFNFLFSSIGCLQETFPGLVEHEGEYQRCSC